eukprot:1642052-Lingulodinium_polyedra.AAC.1
MPAACANSRMQSTEAPSGCSGEKPALSGLATVPLGHELQVFDGLRELLGVMLLPDALLADAQEP